MPLATCIARESKEKRRSIQSVLLPKLGNLFRRSLITQNCNRWIARNKLNHQFDK
jgi:hypothetical protein